MKWIKVNIKTTIAMFSFVSMVIGFIIGVYVTQQRLGNDIDFIKDEIQSIRDNDLWLIRQWINSAR